MSATAIGTKCDRDRLRLNQAHKIYLIRDYAYNFNVHSLEGEALLAKSNAPDVDTKW
ncbi:hypothetical protein [Nostoc sp.]|uniref:hypothetical protein n=1 Tax=Nostoc sp. TaxID=1180 RepID=UPI002FF5D2E1